MNKKGVFSRFLEYYKPQRKVFVLDLLCAFIASMVALMYPMLVRYVTSTAQTTGGLEINIILMIGLGFIGLAVIEYFCNYYIGYIGHVMGARMEYDMRSDLFHHFQKLSFSYYDDAKTGQLMSRITNDLFDVTELAHHGPEDIIISSVKILGSFIILMNINVPLTLVIFIILPVMVVFTFYYNKKMKRAFKRNRQRIADINAQIEDSISGVRVVKSFANEEVEIDKFTENNDNFIASKTLSYQAMGRFQSGLAFFMNMIQILTIVAAAYFISRSLIDVSDLITYLLYIGLLIEPIKKLINFTEQFQNGATGFERFIEIMDIQPDIKDSSSAKEMNNVDGQIEFKDVSFSYHRDDNSKVLNHINVKIDVGDYVAIVGPSGVGKTTLCSLIPRFYEADTGQILIDDNNIRDFKLKSLRKNIGIVQQDIYLFTGTVRDNIAYGKPGAADEEIIKAAKEANAHEFIMEMPEGYDTNIGQRGVKLSGGQKQRLSIARVFLKNPPILIFDEATSALDNESERIVQQSLERLAKNRTTLCIAHRLSTIRNAKTILVLTENGIAERGSHEELMEKNGLYARYYSLSGA
ncbi:MAG: ABC transporter ATP-binding protein [Lachnospiraceae bacterium]